MDTSDILSLLLLFVCLLISAFFSSSEVAFISLQKLRLRHLVNSGHAGAEEVAKIAENPEKFLTTVLLGNNLVQNAAAALATVIAISFLSEGQAVLVATIGVTVLILIFGDVVPKLIATRLGERLALFYAAPVKVMLWVLSPIAMVFIWIADKVARLMGIHPMPKTLMSKDELRTAINAGVEDGAVEEAGGEIMERAIRFGERKVGEVMTQRPDIVWIEKGTNLENFLQVYAHSPHSRFPVYQDTIDNAVGVLWIKDVLLAQANGLLSDESLLDGLLRAVHFVPDSKPLADLFDELQESGRQVAMVVDEFGGISGLITVNQLLEEIVGEMNDELARGQKSFETIDEKTFQISGGMRIEEANEMLQLELPSGEYETVAGFILDVLGRIPKEGEQLKHDNLKLVVTEMKGFKIEKVLVTKE